MNRTRHEQAAHIASPLPSHGVWGGGRATDMIRYIRIGDQIELAADVDDEPATDFAFYDTVSSEFLRFVTGPVFTDRADFIYEAKVLPCDGSMKELYNRCLALIPEDQA